MDPGSLAARSMTWWEACSLCCSCHGPGGTVGRSSGPQVCDTPQAPMAGPAAGWLRAKVTSPWGGQRGAAPPAPRQLSFAMLCPSTGLAQLFPPVHQLHPSSSGPPKEQLVWVLGVFLPAGWLHSLAQGAGWCRLGGLLAGSLLDTKFFLWKTLELGAVQQLSWDQHSPAGLGPCHSKPIFRCGAKRLQQEWSLRVI